jgi:hypothetical protein
MHTNTNLGQHGAGPLESQHNLLHQNMHHKECLTPTLPQWQKVKRWGRNICVLAQRRSEDGGEGDRGTSSADVLSHINQGTQAHDTEPISTGAN